MVGPNRQVHVVAKLTVLSYLVFPFRFCSICTVWNSIAQHSNDPVNLSPKSEHLYLEITAVDSEVIGGDHRSRRQPWVLKTESHPTCDLFFPTR
jgi:hypothetical protein